MYVVLIFDNSHWEIVCMTHTNTEQKQCVHRLQNEEKLKTFPNVSHGTIHSKNKQQTEVEEGKDKNQITKLYYTAFACDENCSIQMELT